MAKLSVHPAELRARAHELDKLRREHQQLMRKMRILVNSLSDNWKGEAQEAFVNNFQSKSKTMSDFDATLAKYIDATNKAASEAEKADKTLMDKVKRL